MNILKKGKRKLIAGILSAIMMLSILPITGLSSMAAETSEVQQRLEFAAEKGLSEWVDTEGYLKEEFYQEKLSHYDLEQMGVQSLINNFGEIERTARINQLQNGIMTRTVTGFRDMVTDGVNVVGYFEVDGRVAVCVEHSVVTPGLGSPTGTPVESFNQELRKVLYYGSYGPAAILGTSDADWVVTSLAASRANGDTAGTNAATSFMNTIAGLPEAPSNFHVWIVDTNGGRTQDLAYWTLDEKGYVNLNKVSANPEITNGNSYYSLAGAVYGVYTEWGCYNEVGRLTTDEWGNTNTLKLNAGTYYVKELIAPQGYALDDVTVHEVTVTASQTATVYTSDFPQSDPVAILLHKKDYDTNTDVPQGSASLESAEFTVKYFSGLYDTNPEEQGIQPTRTWILKTDENGRCRLDDNYKISGDDFWKNSFGVATLPIGTITIQETKAPEGYLLNPEIFIRQITSDGSAESVNTYNEPVIPETVMKGSVELYKSDDESGKELAGAVYGIYFHDGTEVGRLTTDAAGYAKSDLLPYGQYYLQEITAPNGYVLDNTQYPFTISTDGQSAVIETSDKLQKGIINIQKADNESGKPLANAEYEIYAKEDIVTPEGIVKHTAGELLDTVTTNENGFAESKELYLGAYMVREKTAPEGYVLDETEYEITLTYGNPTASVVYSNLDITNANQKGVIQISKTDAESGKPLANAEYEIYAKEDIVTPEGTVKHTAGELIDTVITDENGFAKSKALYLGTYTVKEKTAPEVYILNRTEFDVTLTYGNQTEQVIVTSMETMNANQKGRIKGIKTGEVLTGNTSYSTDFGAAYSPSYEVQPLAGAIYDIYAKYDIITPEGTVKYTAGQLIETVSTNNNGEFLSDDLYLGTYIVKEKQAPKGYVLDETKYEVTLSYGGQNNALILSPVTLSDERQKVTVSVKKEMEENTVYPNPEAYKDVQFGLYAAEDILDVNGTVALEKDSLLEVITLDETLTGTVSMDLPIGSYYLQEIATNEAYVPDTTKYPIDFTYQGQETATVEIVANNGQAIVNELQKGQVELIKESDFPTGALEQGFVNHPLEGAVYGIYSTDGKEVGRLTTDIKGYAKSELLPYGSYYLKEISAPFGYEINETEYHFVISTDGEVITITAKDQPKIGTITPEYTEHGGGENLRAATTGDNQWFIPVLTSSLLVSAVLLAGIILHKKAHGENGHS